MKRSAVVTFLVGSSLIGLAPQASACWSPQTQERQFSSMTNRTRVNHDRRQLKFNDDLSKAARLHSRRMARRGTLFHNDYETMSHLIGGTWDLVGENVGN